MKNSVYFLMMLLGLALTGCEPMEDIHSEVDASLENADIVGVSEYTLTDDDYDALDLDFGNFSSIDDAKALIPQLLTDKFPVWGEGSLALVTFDLYAPVSVEEYTVSDADYEAIGLDVNYFTNTSQIEDLLAYKFPQASEGDFVELTYRTVAEEIAYDLNDDDFELIGDELADTYPDPAESAGQYNNFDRREGRDAYWSNEMILDALNVVLSDEFEGVEGQTYKVTYDIYDGSAGTETMNLRFDGNQYVRFGAEKYELTRDDFDLIGVEFEEEYPGPAGNAAQFNSFDTRETSDNYWSEAMILEAINFVLMERFPDAEEGAEFDVSYDVYSGSVSTVTDAVMLEDGSYVISGESEVSTIMETDVFAFANGDWGRPFTFEPEDYTEMGQRFPNFDDEEVAAAKIETFLELHFPYAEEGDFIPVMYDFYNGDGTEKKYANFVFEGGEFHYIPSVIAQSLQFGHDGTTWVPDNTITYTLTPEDYAYIGEQLTEKYPDPAWSVGNYNNFDRRPGNRNQWTDEMLLEAMNILLNGKVAPNAEEGQKYLLTFAIYNGNNTTEQMLLIKTDGVWIPA